MQRTSHVAGDDGTRGLFTSRARARELQRGGRAEHEHGPRAVVGLREVSHGFDGRKEHRGRGAIGGKLRQPLRGVRLHPNNRDRFSIERWEGRVFALRLRGAQWGRKSGAEVVAIDVALSVAAVRREVQRARIPLEGRLIVVACAARHVGRHANLERVTSTHERQQIHIRISGSRSGRRTSDRPGRGDLRYRAGRHDDAESEQQHRHESPATKPCDSGHNEATGRSAVGTGSSVISESYGLAVASA